MDHGYKKKSPSPHPNNSTLIFRKINKNYHPSPSQKSQFSQKSTPPLPHEKNKPPKFPRSAKIS